MNPLINNIFINLITPLHVKQNTGRPLKTCYIQILNSIIFKIKTNCTWSNVKLYGDYSYSTVFKYFKLWSENKIFNALWENVIKIYSSNKHIKWKFLSVDSSMIKCLKGGECTGPNYQDRNRKGVKLNALVDTNGIPLSIHLSPSNEHDNQHIPSLLNKMVIKRPNYNQYLLADKGYDSANLRAYLIANNFEPIIPYRNNNQIQLNNDQRKIYNKRKVIENYFAKLKQYKSIRIRYERLIGHFSSFIEIANSIIIGAQL